MKRLTVALLALVPLATCCDNGGSEAISTQTVLPQPSTVNTSPAGPTTWPMFGFTAARSNAFAGPTGISAENVIQLERRQVRLPGTADSSAISLPSGLLVLTTSYGKTVAVDPQKGEVTWTFVPDGIEEWEGTSQITQSSPAFANGFVYSYSPDGRIHKLDAGNGREVRSGGWPATITRDPTHEKSAPPLNIANGLVLAATGGYFGDAPPYQGHVVALDASSGRIVNVFNALCSERGELIEPTTCPESGAAIWGRGGVVVEPRTNNLLVSTGNAEWDGLRYWGDSVLELSPDAGELLHTFTPENESELDSSDLDLSSASPAVIPIDPGGEPRFVLQGGKEGVLYLLPAATLNGSGAPGGKGGALATIEAPGESGVFTAPAVWTRRGNAIVFVANSAGTSAYTITDAPPQVEPLWENNTPGTSPVLAADLLYVYNPGGGLNVYEPESGRHVTTLESGPGHWSSPIVVNGIVALPEGSANDHRTDGLLNLYVLP